MITEDLEELDLALKFVPNTYQWSTNDRAYSVEISSYKYLLKIIKNLQEAEHGRKYR